MFTMNSYRIITLFFAIISILLFTGRSTALISNVTTVPPFDPYCCRLESDICGLTLTNFQWSAQSSPSVAPPYPSGNYVWTQSPSAELISAPQYNVTSGTTFSFSLYNYNCPGELYFRQANTGVVTLLGPSDSSNQSGWRSEGHDCQQCCDQFPCDGQLLLVVECTSNDALLAIDNLERDNSCDEVLPCCTFDDFGKCGFQLVPEYSPYTTQNPPLGYSWFYAGQRPPKANPTSKTDYVYFEAVNYTGSLVKLNALLESPPVTLTDSSAVQAVILVNDTGAPLSNNSLVVMFNDLTHGYKITLGVIVLNTPWRAFTFQCSYKYGSCCPSGTCTGTIQFDTQVYSNSGYVMYAVDSFEIVDACAQEII